MNGTRTGLPILLLLLAIGLPATPGRAQGPSPEPPAEAPPPPPVPPRPAWIGVFLGNAADGGVELVEVTPGGPAQKVGLEPGDIVIRVNGSEVLDRESLQQSLVRLHPGDRVSLEILRGGRRQTRVLVATERPDTVWKSIVEPFEERIPAISERLTLLSPRALGARLATIPPELRVRYGAPPDAGALVLRIESAGAARASGVEVGDVLLKVDDRWVRDAGALAFLSDPKTLEVARAGTRRVLRVPPEPKRPRGAASPDARSSKADLEREIAGLKKRLAELERRLGDLKDTE